MTRQEEYIKKAQAKFDGLKAEFDRLKARARGEIADQKLISQEKLDELEKKIESAKARLAEMTDSAGDKLENLKGRFEVLADDIGNSFKKFFSNKELH